ncbi:MAG TPA: Gfo/Idh/MocA family oxidoreductase [Chthonomonadaceae bacterium]|nr:Gfo/Idh/MocA family oxidoreductase [Chthonomonadaceae bacterium]
MTKRNRTDAAPTRRDFLRTTTAAGAALVATGNYAFAQGSDKIRVGIIGCGGRGTGAAAQALNADPGAVLTAMGDVFKERLDGSMAALKGENLSAKLEVPEERRFIGLDAYKKVLATDIDVVLLTTPPGFRPQHIRAAVDAGKHIFAEKPMGTDAAGVRAAYEAAKGAAAKKRAFVAGFCWRYDNPRRAFYSRIHEGAIGAVRHVQATYLTGPVKSMPPASSRPAGMSDTEWQIRNWYNFVWLCGDGLIEQACHSVDKILWAMEDAPPLRCVATGGRDLPNGEGNIYDHIDVFYEWPDGVRATMAQRQIPCQYNDNSDYIVGSSGYGYIKGWNTIALHGAKVEKFEGPNRMYQQEHDEMFASIRKGAPIDNSERMWRSTLVGLMGRMAAYTGEEITWDQMLKSQENLFPDNLDWNGKLAIAPMAIPGRNRFV